MRIKDIEQLIKHSLLAQKVYIAVGSAFFRLISLFIHKKKNQIIFSSLIGKSYSDSPKVLFEAMKQDNRFSNCTYVWAFENPRQFNIDGAEVVSLNSLGYFIKLLESPFWINNVAAARNLRIKPKGTIYLNTMHGVSVLKKDGNAQKNRSDYDRSDVDFQCTCCEQDDIVFCRDFKVKPSSIVRCGMPRNDRLYGVKYETYVASKAKYGLPIQKKVILYAPTWRDNPESRFDIPVDFDLWEGMLGEEYVLLFRAHHLVSDKIEVKFNSFLRNGNMVQDVNELLPAVDVLITDYSSIALDFCLLERPVYSFAYDVDEYQRVRGSYLSIEDVFEGNVFYTQEELLAHLTAGHWDEDVAKAKRMKLRFMPKEGKATKTCIDYLAKHIA